MAYKHNKKADPARSNPEILAKYEQIILDHIKTTGKPISKSQAYPLVRRHYLYVNKLIELMADKGLLAAQDSTTTLYSLPKK